MSYILKEPYASIYEEYLEYEKNLVSCQGYISLKNRTKTVLKWFEDEKLLLEIEDGKIYYDAHTIDRNEEQIVKGNESIVIIHIQDGAE